MSKNNFFILVGGAPGTIWDHIKPKNGQKKGAKMGQKRAKIDQVRIKIKQKKTVTTWATGIDFLGHKFGEVPKSRTHIKDFLGILHKYYTIKLILSSLSSSSIIISIIITVMIVNIFIINISTISFIHICNMNDINNM